MNRKIKALGTFSFLCAIMAIGIFYWVKSLNKTESGLVLLLNLTFPPEYLSNNDVKNELDVLNKRISRNYFAKDLSEKSIDAFFRDYKTHLACIVFFGVSPESRSRSFGFLYYNLLRNSSSDLKSYYDAILMNWKSRHGNESENPRLDELSKYLKNCTTKVSAGKMNEYWKKWNSLDNLKKAAYFN